MNTLPNIMAVLTDHGVLTLDRAVFTRLLRLGLVELSPRGERWQLSWRGRKYVEHLRREEDKG